MDVNPRVPKMGTNVAKRLIHAVVEPETDFYVNNRGIVISAQAFSFNSTDSEVTIDLGEQNDENDRFSYGILDADIPIQQLCRTGIKFRKTSKNMYVLK